jgi:hypothetical protein
MSSQSIYVSLSILSLIGLAGAVRARPPRLLLALAPGESQGLGGGDAPPDACSPLSSPLQGVAVGSGVAMMSMAALEHEAGKPAVAAHSVSEARKAPLSRGFASRGAQ